MEVETAVTRCGTTLASRVPMRHLLLLLVLFAVIPAAEARGRNGARHIVVSQIQATRDGRQAAIDIAIDPKSWRWVQRRKLQVIAHVQLSGERSTRDFRLSDVQNHLVFEANERRDSATVWISGEGRSDGTNRVTYVDYMRLGGADFYSVQLRLRDATGDIGTGFDDDDDEGTYPAPPPPAVNWASRPEVIRACARATSNSTQCMAAASRALFNPAPVIEACGTKMSSHEVAERCVQLALTSPVDPTARLTACRDAMNTYDNILGCFKKSLRARYEPSAAIQACRAAGNTYEAILSCIDVIAEANRDPSDTVKVCRESIRSYDQLNGCISQALTR